jgi:hypothetical protein
MSEVSQARFSKIGRASERDRTEKAVGPSTSSTSERFNLPIYHTLTLAIGISFALNIALITLKAHILFYSMATCR